MSLPGPLAASFILISIIYFFLIFSILFLPGPCPWKIADRYLNASFGFMSLPLALRYSSLTRSPGWLMLSSLSLVRPNCSSRLSRLLVRRNSRVLARPVLATFWSKKATSSFIFSSSSGVRSLNELGRLCSYFFEAIFSEGRLTNRHDVVPLAASVMLQTFLVSYSGVASLQLTGLISISVRLAQSPASSPSYLIISSTRTWLFLCLVALIARASISSYSPRMSLLAAQITQFSIFFLLRTLSRDSAITSILAVLSSPNYFYTAVSFRKSSSSALFVAFCLDLCLNFVLLSQYYEFTLLAVQKSAGRAFETFGFALFVIVPSSRSSSSLLQRQSSQCGNRFLAPSFLASM